MSGEEGENEQEQKIKELTQQVELVKRNSKILMLTSIMMLLIVIGIVTIPIFLKPTPIVPEPTWHEIAEFSGGSHETTDIFNVQGDHFRLYWIATGQVAGETPLIHIYVYPEGETHPLGWRALSILRESDDFSKLYVPIIDGIEYCTSTGRFYIEVRALNISLWGITVEAYY